METSVAVLLVPFVPAMSRLRKHVFTAASDALLHRSGILLVAVVATVTTTGCVLNIWLTDAVCKCRPAMSSEFDLEGGMLRLLSFQRMATNALQLKSVC